MRSTKSLADAIGLPDKEDKLRIQRYLARYEKAHPGEIKANIELARTYSKAGLNPFGEVDPLSQRRYLFELPEEIGLWMSQAYPLMFRSKQHTAWFAQNFKELLIPERY